MVAAYGSSATAAAYTQTSPIVFTKPAATATDDILVAVFKIESASPGTVTPASGWAIEGQASTATPDAMSGFVAWKRAGGSEPANYSFAWTGGALWTTGTIHRFTGAATSGNPFGGSNTSIFGSTTLPSISYTASGAGLGVYFLVNFQDAQTITLPGTYTSRNSQGNGSLTAGDRTDTAGSKTTGTGTSGSSASTFIFAGVLLDTAAGPPPEGPQNSSAMNLMGKAYY